MINVCLLGTGGMLPLPDRALTSLYAEYSGKAVLVDCGEGTQVAVRRAGLKLSKIEAVFITHAHADHIAGLPGLLLSVGNCSRTRPLGIYVADTAADAVRAVISICDNLPYDIEYHIFPHDVPQSFALDSVDTRLTVDTIVLSHRVDCVGYSFSLSLRAEFLPGKARALDVPVSMWRELHEGGTVTLENGTVISSADVTGELRPPIKITYITDTLPIACIAEFAYGSELFVCEGMYGRTEKKPSMNEKKHMLMQDACALAEKAKVKRLWLTHYSPAEKDPSVYEDELRGIFPGVVISTDGMKISI